MRRLIVLFVILGLLILGDFWLKATAESRIATELQSSFDASGEATVELGGFPFTPRLISGSLPVATIASSSLERDGVRFSDVRMTLTDVKFSWSKVLAGEVGSVTIRDGHGRASLKATVLTAIFEAVNGAVDIDFTGGELRATVGPVSGAADLSIEGTDLVIGLQGTERTFSIELPRFVRGLQYRSVRIDGSRAVIEFSLENANFSSL